jgi:hypothetical protein
MAGVPCRCMVCRGAFHANSQAPDELWAIICEDCGNWICPVCKSHDIVGLASRIVTVHPSNAASVRASVWGRPNISMHDIF